MYGRIISFITGVFAAVQLVPVVYAQQSATPLERTGRQLYDAGGHRTHASCLCSRRASGRFIQHDFRGSNFFITQMLHRFRSELAVQALPQELEIASRKAREHLQGETGDINVDRAELLNGRLEADVVIVNLAGHKLPTAYPSRRVWVHLTMRDANGRVAFESGAFTSRGSIEGNDNDADPARYEPHYQEIRRAEDVQIYESIMVDRASLVTTGLLSGTRYIKDNRILPKGFDKASAEQDIAVLGAAANDCDFLGGLDRVRYSANVEGPAPFTIVQSCGTSQSVSVGRII